MATAATLENTAPDTTALPVVLRAALILGIIESVFVLAISLVNRMMEGSIDRAICAVLLVIGVSIVLFWPGRVTRARTIEGISAAAGIGLGATLVYMMIDVAFLQLIGTYTNRWAEVGGGSNWWYHPVWWMVGTFLPWMGAWVLANQTRKSGAPSVPGAIVLTAVLTVIVGVLAVVTHFPTAGWNVPTFGVAIIPASALAVIVSGMGGSRS